MLGPAEMVLERPWMNRIGGPSSCPIRARAAAGRPRPHLWILIVWSVQAVVIWRLLVSVVATGSSPWRAGPHRSGEMYPSPPTTSSGRGMRTSAFHARVGGVILANEGRASAVFVGRVPSSGARARAGRGGRAAARPSWSPGRRASARPGWRPSWRHAPATPGSRSCSAARSIWSAPSCPTSRWSRPCARSEASRRSTGRRRARSCGCSRRRWSCWASARPPRRCCWCWRTCTGPTPPRWIWSSSSPTTCATGGCCCWGPTARTSPPRRAHAPARRRRPALGLGAAAGARPAPARGAGGAAGGSRRRPAAGGADEGDRGPLRGQPVLRRGAAGRRLQRGRAAAGPARPAAAAGDAARPCDAEPVAPGRGRRARRRLPLLRAAAALPERDVRQLLRQAVEHGVLVAVQAAGRFRFRHALLAEAVYATLLPGEREELHARLAEERAQRRRSAGGLAPALGGGRSYEERWPPRSRRHARRKPSSAWRRRWRTSSARSNCGPCRTRPTSCRSTSPGCASRRPRRPGTRARRRARSSSRGKRSSWSATATPCAPLLHEPRRYLHDSGRGDAALAAIERAVELAPVQPPPRARAGTRDARNLLLVAWRYDESVAACEQALALARAVGAHQAEILALRALGASRLPGPRQRGPRAALAGPAAGGGALRSPWHTMRTSRSPTC